MFFSGSLSVAPSPLSERLERADLLAVENCCFNLLRRIIISKCT